MDFQTNIVKKSLDFILLVMTMANLTLNYNIKMGDMMELLKSTTEMDNFKANSTVKTIKNMVNQSTTTRAAK